MRSRTALLERIERWNRAPLTNRPTAGEGAGRDAPLSLEDAVAGVTVETPAGDAWVIEASVDELAPRDGFSATFRECVETPGSSLSARLSHLGRRKSPTANELVFVDLETCGLSNAPVFLVGVLVWENGQLRVRQYFARDYEEEAAILALWERTVSGKRILLSFNGKSFDVPFLRARAGFYGLPPLPEPPHLDLLHEARRVWRYNVPDHKLQTLERHICGRTRDDDIPSRDIPRAYDRYVRTGDASQLATILRHNALDLFTVAELLLRLDASPDSDREDTFTAGVRF
jgi:uncharacterized protein YprB with RNaseH-like and TPR domain